VLRGYSHGAKAVAGGAAAPEETAEGEDMSPQQPTGYRIERLDVDAEPDAALTFYDEQAPEALRWQSEEAQGSIYPTRELAKGMVQNLQAGLTPHQTLVVIPVLPPAPTAADEEAEIRAPRHHRHAEPSETFEQLERRGLA
jgi:hypothetical protein